MKIRNSTFEKKEYRYIYYLYTDEPYIEPQYYTLSIPEGGSTISTGHFTFDGQVFSRTKEHGGNAQSGWSITGKSKGKKWKKH